MIEIFIFHLHILAGLYAFTKRWQEEHIKEGLLAVLIIGLIFSIGWAITGTVARFITPEGGFATWFTSDTLSLILLIIPEFFIFRLFFLKSEASTIQP